MNFNVLYSLLLLIILILNQSNLIKSDSFYVDNNGEFISNPKPCIKSLFQCNETVFNLYNNSISCKNPDGSIMNGTALNLHQCFSKIKTTPQNKQVIDNCGNICGINGIYQELQSEFDQKLSQTKRKLSQIRKDFISLKNKTINYIKQLNDKIDEKFKILDFKISNNTKYFQYEISKNFNLLHTMISNNLIDINKNTATINSLKQQLENEKKKTKLYLSEKWYVDVLFPDISHRIRYYKWDSNNVLHYITSENKIFKYENGNHVHIAGCPECNNYNDGDGKTITFRLLHCFAFDSNNNIYLSEQEGPNPSKIRKITPSGVVTTFSTLGYNNEYYAIDILYYNANLYVTLENRHCIQKIPISNGNSISTFVGLCGTSGHNIGTGTNARLSHPNVLIFHEESFYLGSWADYCLKKITTGGVVTKVFGACDNQGIISRNDGGFHSLEGVSGLTFDENGDLFLSGESRNLIILPRKMYGSTDLNNISYYFSKFKTPFKKTGFIDDIDFHYNNRMIWKDKKLYFLNHQSNYDNEKTPKGIMFMQKYDVS